MKKHKKLRILERANNAKIKLKGASSDIEPENLTGCKIEMYFNKEIIVDGCRGVIEYTDVRISFNIKHGLLIIDGTNLSLYSFEDYVAIVRGNISSVSFER